VEAYGTVDEANSQIGMAIIIATRGMGTPAHNPRVAARIGEVLSSIQNDLFDVGADLATPITKGERPGAALRVTEEQVARLEGWIDEFNERLQPLNSFVRHSVGWGVARGPYGHPAGRAGRRGPADGG
jgi:cob(I)alamin adenosyltransferase